MDQPESTANKSGRSIRVWEEFGIFHVTDAWGRDSTGATLAGALTRALATFPENDFVTIEDLNGAARVFTALSVSP